MDVPRSLRKRATAVVAVAAAVCGLVGILVSRREAGPPAAPVAPVVARASAPLEPARPATRSPGADASAPAPPASAVAAGLVVRAVTVAGAPVAGVRLVAFREDGGPVAADAVSGIDGAARLDVAPGAWLLGALDGRWCAVPVPATTPSTRAVDVVVAPGRRFVLRFRDDVGAAVAGARVHGVETPEVVASADGAVEFVSGASNVTLWATAPGHVPFRGQIQTSVSPQDVVLPRGGDLIVHVREADGRAVAAAEVCVKREMSYAYFDADANGDVVLDGWAAAGCVDVEASSSTGNQHQERFKLAPGLARHEVEVRLPRGRAIAGTVVRAGTGAPIEGARVPCVRSSDGWRQLARTGADGRFLIADYWGDRGDTASFVVVAAGFAQRQEASDEIAPVAGSDPDEFTIEMLDAASVRGRLLDARGKPVVGARVVAMESVNWPEPVEATSASDGRFEIASLPAWAEGLVVLRDAAVAEIPVSCAGLAPRERRDVGDVTLPETFDWTAEIVDDQGRPVARGTLKVTGSTQHDQFGEGVRRDVVDGKFATILGVSAGSYVHVWADGHCFAMLGISPERTRIVVHPAYTVRGRAVLAATGEAFANATFVVYPVVPQRGFHIVKTGPDGAFETGGFAPGRYAAAREASTATHYFERAGTSPPASVITIERDGQHLGTLRLE